MKNKKIIIYIVIIFLILLILGIGYLVYINIKYNENNINEYIPEEEISDMELRKTVISLYFCNPETNSIEEEKREIDSKNLLDNPYKYLVQLLLEGPKGEKFCKIFPAEITIEEAYFENGTVYLKFSSVIDENKDLIIESLQKTLKNLNEVQKIEIVDNR